MILVLVEHDGRRPDESSLETLTVARRLAGAMDMPLAAVLFGRGAAGVARQVGAQGVSIAHVVEHQQLLDYVPAAWGTCLAQLAGTVEPRAILAAGTTRGHEILAHTAALAGLPMAANCVEVRPGETLEVTRLRWGGSVLEDARIHGSPAIISIAEHAVRPEPALDPALVVRVAVLSPSPSAEDLRVRVVERVAPEAGRVSLADARVVVGGGRGVGGAEGFGQLEELAGLLGGTVGVSRVVTSAGWRPHAEQVGQTGTRIAPDLYIACGISGAIQHIVGCRSAKAILAINTDPDAPIMAKATWAVIGDLHTVVPAITTEVRRVGGR